MVAPVAQSPSLIPPNSQIPFTVTKNGQLTTTSLQLLQQYFKSINGAVPLISCNAANTGNVYTLTPLNISPALPNYFSFQSFGFVAPATSTGLVTATVVPQTGSLATLPVYKNHGAAQATTNDITINLFYVAFYVDTLNSGNGGFVI